VEKRRVISTGEETFQPDWKGDVSALPERRLFCSPGKETFLLKWKISLSVSQQKRPFCHNGGDLSASLEKRPFLILLYLTRKEIFLP
jgi:hypothetical protein